MIRLAILLVSLLVSLLGAEVAVRLMKLAPEVAVVAHGRYRVSSNRLIGYEPIPGLKYDKEELTFFDYRTNETNSLGYRDREHQIDKRPGVRRVLVLGDSLAMGLWIEKYDNAFPAKLESYLNQRGVQSEVINFGVVGYNTLQEVATLAERGLQFKPDVVVVEYCLNDRQRDDGFLLGTLINAEKAEQAVSSARLSRSLTWSALYRFLRYRVLAQYGPDYRKEIDREFEHLSRDTVDEAFKMLGELSRTHGFRVLLTVFPDFTEMENYQFKAEHQRLQDIATAERFEFLDLLQPMIECNRNGNGTTVSIDLYHPSEYGHDCAARAMSEAIAAF